VLVQTVNTIRDTESMLAAAAGNPWIGAVVGWLPLTDPDAAEVALDERFHGRLSGVRHLIHREPDPDWLVRPSVDAGLAFLERHGLPFDIVAVFPDHLRHVPTIADRHPDLILVIDHLAKPPIRGPGWATWRAELRSAAERPNVIAKLSGLDTAAGPGWTPDELRPAVDVALEAFGPGRLMFGSDWPVCRLVSTYGQVVEAAMSLVGDLSTSEQAAILGGTAARIYRI
jgi:L-fuconolactonase